MTADAGTSCDMRITDAGLPHRSELLLARERRSFGSMVGLLFSLGKSDAPPPPVTVEALIRGLDSTEPARAYTAAFLIGRCVARDPAADHVLSQRLDELTRHAPEPDVAIEAGMSLVLRGQTERGLPILRDALRASGPLGNQYKAAFYLAEMGDPSGYGAFVGTLHGEIPHYRLMALRHAAGFLPYDGQKVDGVRVDVRALLVEGLSDPEELVRSEVPFYLEELKVPDLRALLTPVERGDPAASVRTAAQMVLERNP